MIHHGHLNALRQAKKLGDVLVVGVHSDGKPILLITPHMQASKQPCTYMCVCVCVCMRACVRVCACMHDCLCTIIYIITEI